MLPGVTQDALGCGCILITHGQAARKGADAAFNRADVLIEQHGFDAGILQQGLQEAKPDRVIAAKKNAHREALHRPHSLAGPACDAYGAPRNRR